MPEGEVRYFVHYNKSIVSDGFCVVRCHEGKFVWPRERKDAIIKTIQLPKNLWEVSIDFLIKEYLSGELQARVEANKDSTD